jgi:hypothetical protein
LPAIPWQVQLIRAQRDGFSSTPRVLLVISATNLSRVRLMRIPRDHKTPYRRARTLCGPFIG